MKDKVAYLNAEIDKEKYEYEQLRYEIAINLVDNRFVVFNKPKKVKKTIEQLEHDYQFVLDNIDKEIMFSGLVEQKKRFIDIRKKMVELEILKRTIHMLEIERIDNNEQDIMSRETLQKIHSAILSSNYSNDSKLKMESELINLYSR